MIVIRIKNANGIARQDKKESAGGGAFKLLNAARGMSLTGQAWRARGLNGDVRSPPASQPQCGDRKLDAPSGTSFKENSW
jgi:hypothetical protein